MSHGSGGPKLDGTTDLEFYYVLALAISKCSNATTKDQVGALKYYSLISCSKSPLHVLHLSRDSILSFTVLPFLLLLARLTTVVLHW